MAAKSVFHQLPKLSCLYILKYNTYNTSKRLTKGIPLLNGTKYVYFSEFVKQYCSAVDSIPIVSYEEVKQIKNRQEVLLIDVREPQELQETGQIPTSINIPLGEIFTELGPNVDKGAFKAKYGRNKPERNTEIVFHCKSGKRSQNAAELAKNLGYQNTKNYIGSWMDWAEKEDLPK